jgi:HK97 family phage major capsid protein
VPGGPGGGLIPPAFQPGIVSKLFEPLGVADVFGSSQTTASQMRYEVEGTATSAAAGVAEGGTKPESTVAYSEVVEPVKKIATVLPISDEFLEDAPSIQAYLNERLGLFVQIEEERRLLRGNGTNELIGLFNRSGNQAINTYTKLGTDDNAVALARVLANTRGSANVMPDTIVLHPANWLTTRLMRDGTGGTIGQFYGGGPLPARTEPLRRGSQPVRRVPLGRPGGAQHGGWVRHGVGRQLRPVGPHLAQGRRGQ